MQIFLPVAELVLDAGIFRGIRLVSRQGLCDQVINKKGKRIVPVAIVSLVETDGQTGQQVFFFFVAETVKEGGIAAPALNHDIIHLSLVGEFPVPMPDKIPVPLRMEDLQPRDGWMVKTMPDPFYHFMLDLHLPETEQHIISHCVDQEHHENYDCGKFLHDPIF